MTGQRTPPHRPLPLPDPFWVGLALLLLATAASRLIGIASAPAGLLDAEAAHGSLARAAIGHGLTLAQDAGERSPLLAGLIALVGQTRGFDIATPRAGAALAAVASVAVTALWLRRALGPAWGLAGGAIVAGAFWPLLFGRLALSPIAGALALAALLWLLQEAIARPRPVAFVWYALAGVAAGIGFMADPPLRMLPLLLLLAYGAAIWDARRGDRRSQTHPDGLLVTLGVVLLIAMPYVFAQHDAPAHLAPWAATLGLPGDAQASPAAVVRGYVVSAARLVWPGTGDTTLNLPGHPLFGLLIAPWVLLGLLVALRRLRTPRGALGFAWGALLLLPAALSDPGHPGRLLAAMPLLVVLPLLGMRAAIGWAGKRRLGVALAGLAIASLLGGALWSGWQYATVWAPAEATARAFNTSPTQALLALRDLPPGVAILHSTRGHDDLLGYVVPDVPRLDFDGRHLLPLPAAGARLVVPAETPVNPVLLGIFDGIPPLTVATGRHGQELYRIYQVDERVRSRLPFAVPTIPFAGGIAFEGYRISPGADGQVAIVLAWRTSGTIVPARLIVRLHTPDDPAAAPSVAEVRFPPGLANQPGPLLTLARLTPPSTSEPVNFEVALLDTAGQPIPAPGTDAAGFLLIDRFRFEP